MGPTERKEGHGEEETGALPQAEQGRVRRHPERPGQGQVVLDGAGPGPFALDGCRRGGPQPHGGKGAGQGREGAGRPGGRLPEAAVVAALLQQVQAPSLPQLLKEVALRVLGGQGPGARRCRAARGAHGRRPRRGRVRVHNGPDQARRVAGSVAPADSAGQGRPGQGVALHHIQVDRPRLRRDEQPRAAPQAWLQAALVREAAKGRVPRRGALLRRLHGASRGGAHPRLRDGHRGGAQVRPPVPAHAVPEAVQVPARAAAREDGGGRAGAARRAREGGAKGVCEAVPPGPNRQLSGVGRLRGPRALDCRPRGGAMLVVLLRGPPVAAEGRLRAQPRRGPQGCCPRAAASASTGSRSATAPS